MKFNYFNSDYFSSPNIRIYFGDILVDEIVHLEYEVKNNKRPLWGYRSVTFDTVAEGTYFIMGSFAINYRINNFLQFVTTYFATGKDKSKLAGLPANLLSELQRIENLNSGKGYGLQNGTYDLNKSNGNEGYSNLSQQFGQAFNYVNMNDNVAVDTLIANYQNTFWSSGNASKPGVSETSKTDTAASRGDMLPPFKITIALGGFSDNPFDRKSLPFTESIHDCYVTSVGKGIDTSGNPIVDSYVFIARDLKV